MILIDFNQTLISSLMSQIGPNKNQQVSEDLIRHIVLSSILSYKRKFQQKYGEIVFCADDKNYWRKTIFPYYKANRKKMRDSSGLDWNLIFGTLNKIRDEIRDVFPYTVIQVPTVEADDIIAAICKYTNELAFLREPEPILILSGDKDFLQLQRYPNIEQWSPRMKKFLKTDDPNKYLKEHIMRGDAGDGIPNFLSPDDVFIVEGKKQKSIMQKKLQVWLDADRPEDFCDDFMLRNYKRNEQLIDLRNVPKEHEQKIIEQYKLGPKGNRKFLFNYFIKKRLKYLLESIGDF